MAEFEVLDQCRGLGLHRQNKHGWRDWCGSNTEIPMR